MLTLSRSIYCLDFEKGLYNGPARNRQAGQRELKQNVLLKFGTSKRARIGEACPR